MTQQQVAQRTLPDEEYKLFEALDGDPMGAGDLELEDQAITAAFTRLSSLQDDPHAVDLLERLQTDDPIAQGDAVRQAATYLRGEHDRAAVEHENAVASGMYGAAAPKRSLQGASGATAPAPLTYEDWGSLKGQRKIDATQVERLASPADPDRMSRAEMHGQLFASAAEERFPEGRTDMLARLAAFRLTDLATQMLDTKAAPTETQLRAVAADMANLYGREKAAELVGRVAQTTPTPARPMMDALGAMLGDWPAQAQTKRAADDAMADRMLQLLPPEQQQALRKEGTRDLLAAVRLLSENGAPPAARRQIEQRLGGTETTNRMLEIYGEALREQELPGPAIRGPSTFQSAQNRLSSDDIADEGEEGGDFEKRQGERKVQKNSAPAMYMFYGDGAQSLRTSDGNRRNPRNPFEPERGALSPEEWKAQEGEAKALGFINAAGKAIAHRPRPRLLQADDVGAAREQLAGKIAQMEKNLGAERTPAAYAKAVRAEKAGDLTIDERKARERLDELETKAAAGDEAAAKQLVQDAQDFFADRLGKYRVEPASAAQVLDEMGMPRAGRLALYRDMMFQEARRAANAKEKTAQTRAAAADAIWQAGMAHTMLVREMQGGSARLGKLSMRERHAISEARERVNASTQLSGVVAWARQNLGAEGAQRLERAMAGMRAKQTGKAAPTDNEVLVDDAMQRYFERGYMVRATTLTDRTPGEISAGELVEMARAGERARSAAGGAERVDGDDGAVAATEGTLLNFKQPAGRNMLGTKKGEPSDLAIPTEALVNWVRQNRREDFADNADGEELREKDNKRSVNERFVTDLVAGISALVDSGLVQGEPYVIDASGKQQRFRGVDGVPDALQLPSMSGKEYKQGIAKKAAEEAAETKRRRDNAIISIAQRGQMSLQKAAEVYEQEQEARRQKQIGKDQSKDEPITQDPLIGLADNAQYSRQVEPGARSFVRGDGTRVPARSTARAVREDPQVSTPAPDPLAAPTAYAEARGANASAVARKAAERKARLERSNKSAPADETPIQRAARLKRLEESEASRTASETRRSLRTGAIREVPAETTNIGGAEITVAEGGKYREARRSQASPTVEVNEAWTAYEDGVTPLDTQLFLNEGQAEFDEQRQRSGDIPRTAYESRAGALRKGKAEDRAAPIIDKLRSTVEGKPEHRQDAAGALADVRLRLRVASRTGQDGGVQYAFPLAHVLNPDVLGTADLTVGQAQDFVMMRSALAALAADDKSLSAYERTQVAKRMAGKQHAEKVTAANAQQLLQKAAQQYRDYRAQRLAEKQAPKTPAPAAPSRSERLTARVVELVASENYESLDTDGKVDAFIAAAQRAKADLDQLGDQRTPAQEQARDRLHDMLKKDTTFDWASLYPSWKGDSGPFDARIAKALGRNAAPEVAAAGAPKSSQPGGAGVKRNAQGAGKYEGWKTGPTARQQTGVASDAEISAAREYLDKVLGPQIKVQFEAITGYSGEWLDAEQTIRLSTMTTAGIGNVARHEAVHAFWSRFAKDNPRVQRVLDSLVNDERVMRRLQALLKDEPAALAQLTDGEERLAYIHQFAAAGMLRLPHTPGTTLMAKVRKFLRQVFMLVSDQERAVDLLYAFEAGKLREPTAADRVIAKALGQGDWLKANPGKLGALSTRLAGLAMPAHSILMNSVSPSARRIGELFFANPGDERDGGKVGYLNARNQKIRQYTNVFRDAIAELSAGQGVQLVDAMQREVPDGAIKDPDVLEARARLRGLFDRFHRYMTDEKGLRMGKINENYFPVVFDAEKVLDGSFAEMLRTKYAEQIAQLTEAINKTLRVEAAVDNVEPTSRSTEEVIEAVVNRIARTNPMDDDAMTPLREDGVLRPWFASGEKRVLNFLDPEDRAQFQEKDLIKTVTRYVHQGVRAAEYSSRFGRNGAQLHVMLRNADRELEAASKVMMKSGDFKSEKARQTWVKRQYVNVANAAGAMEGSLGHDVPEWVRNASSAAVVYQNVRLLPLALFASFVDPLGIVVRGGEMKEAFSAFVRGIKGVARNWGDMLREEPAARQKDRWEELAELAGVIDAATFSHLLSDEYGSVYHGGKARAINETMFKANGLEPWNRAMRVAATQSAVKFLLRHNKDASPHSARWMKELGFQPGQLPLDADGQLITRKEVLMHANPGMSREQAEAQIDRVHSAIVRWVEGAILSPSAAHRPAWASDPHYGMFWHLKQFAYSFHHTMLTRARNEAKHGEYAAMGALAWYVPTMIASDVSKAVMLGAGELPGYMQGYDLVDWAAHGVGRSGLLGMGQLGVDAVQDPAGIPGPMVDQVWEAIVDPVERTVVRAMPVNSLYSRAIF